MGGGGDLLQVFHVRSVKGKMTVHVIQRRVRPVHISRLLLMVSRVGVVMLQTGQRQVDIFKPVRL